MGHLVDGDLTSLFTDGLANILIWGYAEPAIGMIVGNLATLRPLFRRMFGSGSESSTSTGAVPTIGGVSSRSHPYKSFDPDYDLGPILGNSELTSTQVQSGHDSERHARPSSDSDSQKQILEMPIREQGGIVVSRQFKVSRA